MFRSACLPALCLTITASFSAEAAPIAVGSLADVLSDDFIAPMNDASLTPPADVDPVVDVPPELEGRVGFWVDVMGVYTLRDLLIHDSERPESILAVYRIPDHIETRTKASRSWVRRVDRLHRAAYRTAADALEAGERVEDPLAANLYVVERALADTAFVHEAVDELRRLSRKMRTQVGLRDVFAASYRRSGRYFDAVQSILLDAEAPPIIAFLPYLESGYDPNATSHLNAGGLWQFTRSTGGQYMTIDDVVDERYDPYLATRAAASYLTAARDTLGSWPLAITSYNYGVNGTLRAVAKHGTDLMAVLTKHDGRAMGFAARNFYAEFVAVTRVMSDPARYFEDTSTEPALTYDVIRLDGYINAQDLAAHIETDVETLARLNPGFRRPVWRGERRVPPSYPVRVPPMELDELAERIHSFPVNRKHRSQTRASYHHIRPGETLAKIAARYRTSVDQLVQLNALRDVNRIVAGQQLRIPR